MALSRTYLHKRVYYGPQTPMGQVPKEVKDMDKLLQSDEYLAARARRHGRPYEGLTMNYETVQVEPADEPAPVEDSGES